MKIKKILKINLVISLIVFTGLCIILALLLSSLLMSYVDFSKADAIVCSVIAGVLAILIVIQACLSKNGHEKLIK